MAYFFTARYFSRSQKRTVLSDELLARYDVDLADEDREKLVRGIKIKKKRETLI